MGRVTGKFSRQYRGIGYSALVIVEIIENTDLSSGGVMFAENWSGYAANRWIGNGDPHWQQAAVIGVNYAFRIAGQRGHHVTVVSIDGNYTVTNPTIVGAAAIDAVWQSISYRPSPAETQQIESIVFSSWQHTDPFSVLPDFEQQKPPQSDYIP